jgi:CRISPR-associated protein Csa2
MKDLFISVRGRVLINVEALNMTESVGNYVKHRRVPVISPTTYATYFVPAISGEALAHGFQKTLVEKVKGNNELKEKLCNLCKQGIFLKSTNNSVIYDAFKNKLENWKIESEADFEKMLISNCIIEDIGGFLYAPGQLERGLGDEEKDKLCNIGIMEKQEKKKKGGNYVNKFENIKRTSNFSTGFMIPAKEAVESVVIEPQLHSRYALGTPFVERGARGQMLYYVELSSAPYVFSFDLDTKYIGRLTFNYERAGELAVEEKEREKRIDISLESLKSFLIEMMFGAKKTRFLPIVDWESVVIALSNDIWTVTSSLTANYIINTLDKQNKINNNTELFVYINPMLFEDTSIYIKKRTDELLESFYNSLEEFRKRLEEKGDANILDWNEFKKRKLEEFLERKVNELVESSDLKYISIIQKKYNEAKKRLGDKLYESFEECVSTAIEEAKRKRVEG